MASRRPLSARNVDHTQGRGKPKKERYPFALLDRATLVQNLRHLTKDSSFPVNVCEDDLLKPTPEKIQQIYFSVLSFVFGVLPDALKQPSFNSHRAEHPELIEDFIYRAQFFRLMKRLMSTCLVPDFKFTDIVSPEPKRVCRNLSAIINYIKFHFNCMEEGGAVEYQKSAADVFEEMKVLVDANTDLREKMNAMERQRCEEHELEEELKRNIAAQEQEICAARTKADSLVQQCQAVGSQKAASENRMAELSKEFEKWSLRNDDLKRQIVSSPDKLRACLLQLQQEVEEAKENTKQFEVVIRMWESLASKAHQVPPVLKSLNEGMDILMDKVDKRGELHVRFEDIGEHIERQKQVLREATAKHQNMVRHLKLVEEEFLQMDYEDHRVPHSQVKDDLERDVCLLQQEVHRKEVMEAKFHQDTEEQKQRFLEKEALYKEACSEIDEAVEACIAACRRPDFSS